jgi:hypothetical protein
MQGQLGDGSEAERCYLFTNHGVLGYLFKVASEYVVDLLIREGPEALQQQNLPRHFYVVADRIEDENEVYLRADYVTSAARPVEGK